MGKRHKWTFQNKGIELANKHMKQCLKSLLTRYTNENQNDENKNSNTIRCW